MNSVNESKSWVKRWLIPLTIACCVMALVFSAVPMTGVPATVMGGYGGGGGGGGFPSGPYVWPFYYAVPQSTAGTLTMTILRQYVVVDNIDLSSLTINGVHAVGAVFSGDGLVLTFDLSALNLPAGTDHVTLTGKYKDGSSFSITISI